MDEEGKQEEEVECEEKGRIKGVGGGGGGGRKGGGIGERLEIGEVGRLEIGEADDGEMELEKEEEDAS